MTIKGFVSIISWWEESDEVHPTAINLITVPPLKLFSNAADKALLARTRLNLPPGAGASATLTGAAGFELKDANGTEGTTITPTTDTIDVITSRALTSADEGTAKTVTLSFQQTGMGSPITLQLTFDVVAPTAVPTDFTVTPTTPKASVGMAVGTSIAKLNLNANPGAGAVWSRSAGYNKLGPDPTNLREVDLDIKTVPVSGDVGTQSVEIQYTQTGFGTPLRRSINVDVEAPSGITSRIGFALAAKTEAALDKIINFCGYTPTFMTGQWGISRSEWNQCISNMNDQFQPGGIMYACIQRRIKIFGGLPVTTPSIAGNFAAIYNGSKDNDIANVAEWLKGKINDQVQCVIRLGWENNQGYPWNAQNDPEGYARAYNHIVDVFRDAGCDADHFIFNFCVQKDGFTLGQASYPSKCQELGVDFYDGGAAADVSKKDYGNYPACLNKIKRVVDWAASLGKPVTIDEVGMRNYPERSGGGDNPYFVRNLRRYMDATPAVKALSWFKMERNVLNPPADDVNHQIIKGGGTSYVPGSCYRGYSRNVDPTRPANGGEIVGYTSPDATALAGAEWLSRFGKNNTPAP